jgi:cysteinyl-tRNA synthetase
VRPVELRYYLVGAHYRSMLEYSDESVKEAGQGYRRIEGFLQRAFETLGSDETLLDVVASSNGSGPSLRSADFDAAMDDDLSVPAALAVLHEVVRVGNAALTSGDDAAVRSAFVAVLAMVDVLGVNPWAWAASSTEADSSRSTIDALVRVALDQRQEARARKDFAAADAIRDGLDAIGIKIEDTANGVRWNLEA